MTPKLSSRQQYVLNRAHEYHLRDWNYGYITTSRGGEFSISPNTCKALEKMGLLAQGNACNEYRITDAGLRQVRNTPAVSSRGKVVAGSDAQAALARWNAAARGKDGGQS